MANAKQCDRCGSHYTICLRNKIIIKQDKSKNENKVVSSKTMDLCPKCMGKLLDFITHLEVEDVSV